MGFLRGKETLSTISVLKVFFGSFVGRKLDFQVCSFFFVLGVTSFLFRHFGVTQQTYDGVVSYESNNGGIPDDK